MNRLRSETNFSEYVLSKFTKASPNGPGVEKLISRYQSLAILYVNFFFLAVLVTWKLISLILIRLPGDEVIFVLTPIQIISLTLIKRGKKEPAALFLLIAVHTGNFIASKVCNVTLGAAYLVILLPGLAYFVSSSVKIHATNFFLCLIQNIGHMWRVHHAFKVTFTDDQQFQIFTLELVSFMYLGLSWLFFALQKSIETQLWQVAHSNYKKAENITKELIEAVESKDKVVSSFSHEIRNPLNSLNGSIDYLLKIVKDPTHMKVLKNAKLSGEILLNLVNNILDAAKLKSEKIDIACTETNPIDIIKKVLSINAEIITEKKLKAKAYIDKLMPSQLYIDSSRLLQVIMNLFSNATKFVSEGGKIEIYLQWCPEDLSKEELLSPFIFGEDNSYGAKVDKPERPSYSQLDGFLQIDPSAISNLSTIEEFENLDVSRYMQNMSTLHKKAKRNCLHNVKSQIVWMSENFNLVDFNSTSIGTEKLIPLFKNDSNKRGYLKVQIADSGCGILQENIPKLFKMFSQGEGRVQHGGTGLGLWICKQLCQKMGGDIAISSKVNVGTSVTFYIAVNNDALSSVNSMNSRLISDEKVRALVVDDFPYNRDVHKLILEREGVEVSIACDGKEAYEKYIAQGEGYFSFIMMDIQMPIMDGITSAQLIRKFERENHRKEIDIYFVSGNYYSKTEALGSVNSIGQGSNLLNTQFLRKPIDVEIVKKISDKYSNLLKKNL